MTDLLLVLPDFPTKTYTHLIPSLEKNVITTTDILTLDAAEIGKRAQLPPSEIRRLSQHVLLILQTQLGVSSTAASTISESGRGEDSHETENLRLTGKQLLNGWSTISTLDPRLDGALGGGFPTGYLSEITGESGAGKTQLLLTLLLSAQLPAPYGLSRPTMYISTEHPLPTKRLRQLLNTNSILASHSSDHSSSLPSLSQILSIQTPDLETQDHILTYQLPVALRKHHVGLVVIDSIAANYRAEASTLQSSLHPPSIDIITPVKNSLRALAARSTDLLRTGALLRFLAREHDCVIVVANQVADRFAPRDKLPPHNTVSSAPQPRSQPLPPSSSIQNAPSHPLSRLFPSSQPSSSASSHPPSSPSPAGNWDQETPALVLIPPPDQPIRHAFAVHPALSLDHQQKFFTGWGDLRSGADGDGSNGEENAKTPTLGLVWANQIACRVALVKEMGWGQPRSVGGDEDGEAREASADWTPRRWRRWARVVFAPWTAGVSVGERGIEFEIGAGGLRSMEEDK